MLHVCCLACGVGLDMEESTGRGKESPMADAPHQLGVAAATPD